MLQLNDAVNGTEIQDGVASVKSLLIVMMRAMDVGTIEEIVDVHSIPGFIRRTIATG